LILSSVPSTSPPGGKISCGVFLVFGGRNARNPLIMTLMPFLYIFSHSEIRPVRKPSCFSPWMAPLSPCPEDLSLVSPGTATGNTVPWAAGPHIVVRDSYIPLKATGCTLLLCEGPKVYRHFTLGCPSHPYTPKCFACPLRSYPRARVPRCKSHVCFCFSSTYRTSPLPRPLSSTRPGKPSHPAPRFPGCFAIL